MKNSLKRQQLIHEATLLKASDGLTSITALACSPKDSRLCVATNDRALRFLGGPPRGPSETEEIFVTRAADKGKPQHLVTGLAFSPDGSQVAVAQSDGVVHVYGVNAEGRRCICCRLPVGCTATCLAWATGGNSFLFIGLVNGRVRVADVAKNKLGTLHEAHSPVTSLACTQDGAIVVSGHRSGQVLLHRLADASPAAALRSLAVLKAPVTSVQIQRDAVACAAANLVHILGLDGTVIAARCSSSEEWVALHREEDEYEDLQLLHPLLQQQEQRQQQQQPREQVVLAVTTRHTVGVVVGSKRVYRLQQRTKGNLRWLGELSGFCIFHEVCFFLKF
ncbi:hypothetical protein, conserved [Eimeria praecox]|uniref:WD domain, G-beta repeat-containing protein n=1 Tax=Eimeria praecox TaxID=51316 RepID=U6G4I7_9EIME|nr:hypothetical protein, conserved [Eimeria praecox]